MVTDTTDDALERAWTTVQHEYATAQHLVLQDRWQTLRQQRSTLPAAVYDAHFQALREEQAIFRANLQLLYTLTWTMRARLAAWRATSGQPAAAP